MRAEAKALTFIRYAASSAACRRKEEPALKLKDGFVLREIAGEYIIIPTGEGAARFGGLITVNEVASYIWRMLQSETSFDRILRGVLEEYDVPEDIAAEDINEFLNTLRERGILQE